MTVYRQKRKQQYYHNKMFRTDCKKFYNLLWGRAWTK